MKYDVLYNFISPVTGRIKVDQGYIIVGDKENIGMPSPILIDIRQDIIDLRRKLGGFEELNKLDHNRIWIGDYNNEPVEQLHIGVINLPPLAEALFPNPISPITGDFRIPNPTFDYLSPFDWVMSGPFLPQIYATKYDILGNPVGTDVSSSLAMTQVRAAQIMKRFDNANFIVGSSTVEFVWENPKMYLIPEALKQLYGLGTTYTFTKAQSLGALETGLLKNTVNNGTGTLSTAVGGKDYVDIAPLVANMQLALIRPEVLQEGVDVSKFITRIQRLPSDNMPNLTTGKYWKGGANNIPIEVDLPTYAPTDATYILQTPHNLLTNAQALSEVQSAVTTGQSILKVNHLPLTNSYKLAYAQGGVNVTTDDYITPTNLSAALESVMGYATSAAWDSFVLGAVVSGITALFGATISSAYGEYLFNNKYKPLQSEFTYQGTDDMSLWGQGNIWVDVKQKLGGPNNANYRPGIRLTSWDSSFLFSDDSPPLSIGIFGYKKNDGWFSSNNLNRQRGFVWQADMENDTNHENYRFPKKFSLRSVGHDFIYTLFGGSETTAGWHEANHNGSTITTVEKDEELMSYDKYEQKFTFEKTITINQYTIYQSHINIPSEDGSVFLHKVIID